MDLITTVAGGGSGTVPEAQLRRVGQGGQGVRRLQPVGRAPALRHRRYERFAHGPRPATPPKRTRKEHDHAASGW